MRAPVEVVCIGAATLDVIALVDALPAADERVQSSSVVTAGGGPAATAAVTLARAGVPVAICGVVGDDDAGRAVRSGLEDEGVDVSALRVDRRAQTARSLVLVDRTSGSRTIVTSAAPAPTVADVPQGAAWLHADQTGYRAARAAVRGAQGGAPRLSIDGGNDVPDLDLAGVSLYAPTLTALVRCWGDDIPQALLSAHRAGADQVVATAGADGAHLLQGSRVLHVPAHEAEVVSTLGAGDVFHGALLAALVHGEVLAAAVRAASRVAALSCRGLDGRSGLPDVVTTSPVDELIGEIA